MPLRLLGTKARVLIAEEAEAAMRPADERVFVVRYAGGEHGGPIEPVRSSRRASLSPSTTSPSRRARPRCASSTGTMGPCAAAPSPPRRSRSSPSTPVELYTQEIDPETHNIVQVYFSDLRDEVAVDVLNLTGHVDVARGRGVLSFPPDATGAALNYKIIVRDGAVIAVLYQEDGIGAERRSSSTGCPPLVRSSRCPTAASASLARSRAASSSRASRATSPSNLAMYPCYPGLRHRRETLRSCPVWLTCN